MKEVRVRIAPSPTGIPHIGNTRTALFNYLFAKHNKGKFILRIEDTDRARFVPESIDAIYEILNWLGLKWDEEYVQSKRLDTYKKYAQELLDKGFAFKDEGAIRFKMPKEGGTEWIEAIGNRAILFENKTQEDFVILKSDGFPTYNFANVIDDHLMKISHVFRGYEFISSTPKHIQLYKAFGWQHPIFVHLPVILGADHSKLSKRHGAKSVLEYRQEGYLKEALINFMTLLGWNPGGEKEIMSIDEMIEIFDLKDVNTASPIFDVEKLKWMNGIYIRQDQISNIKYQILELMPEFKNMDNKVFDGLISLAQSRMVTLCDFRFLANPFLENPDLQLNEKEKEVKKKLLEELSKVEKWEQDNIFSAMKKVMLDENIKMPVIYKILTGNEKGLPLPQALEIYGKDKTLKRLDNDVK